VRATKHFKAVYLPSAAALCLEVEIGFFAENICNGKRHYDVILAGVRIDLRDFEL
jgi:hypothetical protein